MLYNPDTFVALIIIAEEVEILIPELRNQQNSPIVHLLTYAAPVTKRMLHFSDLRYYVLPSLPKRHIIPESLTIEIGIFSGCLYLHFDECTVLREYLDNPGSHKQLKLTGNKMLNFLLEWLSVRRNGQDVTHTPVGYICQSRPLEREHGFFVTHYQNKNVVSETLRNNDADEATDGTEEEGFEEYDAFYSAEEDNQEAVDAELEDLDDDGQIASDLSTE